MTIYSHSEADTAGAGALLARRLKPGQVCALYGELGAGKTAFVRGAAAALGCGARVSSPTFTIVNEYPGDVSVFHFDMYRLASSDELFEIGWEDYLRRDGISFVEWSENVEDAIPPEAVRVRIEKTGETERRITVTGGDGE